MEHAIAVGGDGYLLKEDAPEELLSAIRTIQKGEIYMSPLMVPHVTEFFIQSHKTGRSELLTARETEILKLIAEGKASKEIADFLGMSIRTVDNHRCNIMRKLNVSKSVSLVRQAISMGYVHL